MESPNLPQFFKKKLQQNKLPIYLDQSNKLKWIKIKENKKCKIAINYIETR